MADAKGTYFGPGERGLATILPGSPNFAGLVQSAQTANLRREKMAQDAAAKRQKDRDAAVNSVYSALSKPHTTALIYQKSLNEKTFDALSKLEELVTSGASSSDIRAFGASQTQALMSHATAGKQVAELIDEMRKWNQANGKMIDEGKLMSHISDKMLVGEDGQLTPPEEVPFDALSVENIVYGDKDGAGAQFLVKGEVIKNLLKKEELKAAVVENKDFTRATDLPPGKVGFEETRTKTKLQPFADINPVTGKVEIMDAERLVDSPVFQVLMNDRAFATLVENEVTRLYAPKDSPDSVYIPGAFGGTREVPLNKKDRASQDELDFLRAKAAVSLLNGTQLGGSEVFEERKVRMQNQFQRRSSGKAPASVVKEQNQLAGYDRFQRDILSGDIGLMEDAVSWLDKKLGLSETSRSALSEAIGAKPDWELEGLTTKAPNKGVFSDWLLDSTIKGNLAPDANTPKENIVYAKFKKGRSGYEYVQLDVSKLTGDRGIQYYLETSDKFMDYKAEKPGVDYDLPEKVEGKPSGFSIYKK